MTDTGSAIDRRAFLKLGVAASGVAIGCGVAGTESEEPAAPVRMGLRPLGGTAGVQYDPCYHLACDTYANVNLEVLDVNADAIAYATLYYALNPGR